LDTDIHGQALDMCRTVMYSSMLCPMTALGDVIDANRMLGSKSTCMVNPMGGKKGQQIVVIAPPNIVFPFFFSMPSRAAVCWASIALQF
jgi:hypothetical protein